MATVRELTPEECVDLLGTQVVGRAAICTPNGPHVVPVNYVVHRDAIVFRTAPYSVLGTFGWAGDIAFEVDDLDPEHRTGWSVVALGKGEMLDDLEEIEEVRWARDPEPWAEGPRPLYVRVQWRRLTGRRLV